MQKILMIIAAGFLCLNSYAQDKKESYFGKKITADNARPASEVPALLAKKDTVTVKLTGKINSVCQKKGCWMMMETADGNTMRVRFKDYDFFVPKDCAGKTAVIQGIAFNDVTSVAELRHYAEDAKKSKEEIEKITEPEKSPAFEAEGVIIYE
ncbi:MAG: hypothetical protein FNNCIFGK_01323 [Bacteroidia bacterium]|nr:hypothetical protein [Bacteroidia bacterium]MBX3105567.1 DUF4920 domain-containing protein [Bacteroidota bacterium]MCE7954875.1 DUF4920 domain-containing protein [Bacteroidetes bacterium CHB6]MCB0850465.1 DUF4920 domain-containing protein [Bacteroidota bacterium]MCB8931133.1 DUF4920 domain-containing protein [Bacteroidia bacterium]